MKNPKLSNRYAKALFDFAGEKNQIEEVFGDLQLFANTLKDNRELQMLLRNPVVPPNQKHQIFESVFNGTLHETTYQFLDLLLKKRREPDLDSISEGFFRLYNQSHNIRPRTSLQHNRLATNSSPRLSRYSLNRRMPPSN